MIRHVKQPVMNLDPQKKCIFHGYDITDRKHRAILQSMANTVLVEPDHKTRWDTATAKNLTNQNYPSEVWFRDILVRKGFLPQGYGRKYKKNKSRWRYSQNHLVGRYKVDFLFLKVRVAIEIDGRSHNNVNRLEKDHLKDLYLKDARFRVYRIKHGDEKEAARVVSMLLDKTGLRERQKKRCSISIEKQFKAEREAARFKQGVLDLTVPPF